jgi:phosphate:Na+ symporter
MTLYQLLTIVGSLGLFIYGMMIMSDGIQKMAGTELRKILTSITSNRFKGIFTGFTTTTLLQSSSATTVMIVSFVNAGLLTLRQAIGVIMGANIGTTMTAWLIVFLGFSKFSVDLMVFPILAFGVPLLFFNEDKLKNIGEFLIGFGVLFLGIASLKASVEVIDLANNLYFKQLIDFVSNQGFLGFILMIFIGTLVTIIVQSSSAAMALTLTLCGTGLPYEMAAAIILGENIGTTITANLAALVGNVHAKRAARAHLIFNIFGVLWMILLFQPFSGFAEKFIFILEESGRLSLASDDHIRYSLSAFHTAFNIVNTLLLVWFVNLIEKTVIKITPSKSEDDEVFKLEYIGNKRLSTPEVSVLEAKKEVLRFLDILERMQKKTSSLVGMTDKKVIKKLLGKINHYEEITDRMHAEINSFLIKLLSKEMSENTLEEIRALISINGQFEIIGDILHSISKKIERKNKAKIWFDQDQRNALIQGIKLIDDAFKELKSNLNKKKTDVDLELAWDIEKKIDKYHNKQYDNHIKNIDKMQYPYESGLYFSKILGDIEKIGDYILNISELHANKNLE